MRAVKSLLLSYNIFKLSVMLGITVSLLLILLVEIIGKCWFVFELGFVRKEQACKFENCFPFCVN